jgi:hypothetical protein
MALALPPGADALSAQALTLPRTLARALYHPPTKEKTVFLLRRLPWLWCVRRGRTAAR